MKAKSKDRTAGRGEALVQEAFESINLAFRKQNEADYGIDAHVELISNEEKATGQLLALQIKAGPSYLSETNGDNIVFRVRSSHINYWLNHSLPVVVCICDIENRIVYWQSITASTVFKSSKNYKVLIPKSQVVSKGSLGKFLDILTPIVPKNKYTILRTYDQSLASTRRISLSVLLNGTQSKTEVAAIVRRVSLEGIKNSYHRNSQVEEVSRGGEAQVVWVLVYLSQEDVNNNNYICRSIWVSDLLPVETRPISFEGDNIGNNIILEWNKNYSEIASASSLGQSLDKGLYLNVIRPLLDSLVKSRCRISELIEARFAQNFSELSFLSSMEAEIVFIEELEQRFHELSLAPHECHELDELVNRLIASMSNIALYYSELGLERWEEGVRHSLAKTQIDEAKKIERDIEYVFMKIR